MNKTGPRPESIFEKKQKALDLMLSGLTKKEVAEQMGVAVSTVKRWYRDPAVRKAFLETSKSVIKEVKGVLIKDLVPISDSLVDIALNARSEMARYRACRHILELFGIIPPKVSVSFEKKQIVIMKKILKE